MYVIEKENGVCFKNLAYNRKYFLFVYIEQFIIKLSEMVIFPKVLKVKLSLSTQSFFSVCRKHFVFNFMQRKLFLFSKYILFYQLKTFKCI